MAFHLVDAKDKEKVADIHFARNSAGRRFESPTVDVEANRIDAVVVAADAEAALVANTA